MASAGSVMFSHSFLFLGPGLYEALRLLLNIIAGIGEGSLQGLTWQVLYFTRSVVKERLALAAFSPCLCSSLSISQTVSPGSGLFGNWGSSSVIGCRCTGWQEGAVGTLACGRNVDSLLFRELLVLRACFNNILAPASPVQPIQNQLARITLLSEAGKMA